MEYIKWVAVASNEWITLFSNGQIGTTVTGYGNTNIDIVVEPAIPGTDREAGTVTITSEDGSVVKVINVQRCGGDCGCDKVKTNVESITFNWDDDDSVKKPFMTIPSCVENEKFLTAKANEEFDVDLSPLDSIYSVFPTSINETDSPKYGELVVQYGACESMLVLLQQNPNLCTCEGILAYDCNWDDDESGSKTILENKSVDCYSFGDGTIEKLENHKYKIGDVTIQFQGSPDGWFEGENGRNIKVSGDKTAIYVRPKDDNNSDDKYECTVSVNFLRTGMQQECNPSLTLTQNGRGGCDCDSIIINSKDIEWKAEECGTDKMQRIASGVDSKCVKNLKYTCNSDHFILTLSNGMIYAYTKEPNTSIENNITGTVEINYSLPDGTTSCGPLTKKITHKFKTALYIHYSYKVLNAPSETYIPNSGATVEIKYYLSKIEDDDESQAITDADVLNKTSFRCPEGITCEDITAPSDGIFKRDIHFGKLSEGDNGKDWLFMIYHPDAVVSPKQFTIYQASKYENIIPNCDYFIFNYEWTASDGEDLDSLTRISVMKKSNGGGYIQKSCKIGYNELSGRTVGFGGTVSYRNKDGVSRYAPLEVNINGKNVPLLVFGGDNMCNGSEYTVICFKNLIEYGTDPKIGWISMDDEIWIDIYANWFKSKGPNHKMDVKYVQYSGLTDSPITERYAAEIDEGKITPSCSSEPYFVISGKPEPICSAITSVSKTNISVNAAGIVSPTYALNTDCLMYNESVAGIPYEHVFRLKYNVKENRTYMEDIKYVNKGIDNTIEDKIVLFTEDGINKHYRYGISYDYTVPSSGKHFVLDNFYFKYDGNGVSKEIYPFDINVDYIDATEWTGGNQKHHFISGDFNNAGVTQSYDLTFIHNLKITKYTDGSNKGKLKIEFDYDAGTDRRQFDLRFTTKVDFLFPCTVNYCFNSINFNQNY